MSLNPIQIISSALIFIRDELRTDVTDPKVATRPSDNDFIITAYPSHDAFYPHIVIQQVGGSGMPESVNAPITFQYDMLFSIDVMSKSTKELDEICGQVIAQMLNNVATFRAFGLHAMKMPLLFRNNPVTDPGVHRKSAEYVFYMHIAQA